MSIADKLLTIAENEKKIHDEVVGQSDLIAQIKAKVNSLPEAGGGGVNIASRIIDGTATEITAQDLAGATKIRTHAFAYYKSLTSVTIPDSVTSIGDRAFVECGKLNTVNISNSVTSIINHAFYYCSSLKTVTIPHSVTGIGSQAFYGCSKLTSVEFGNGVNNIGAYTFYNCSALKRLDFSTHTQIPTLNYDAFTNNPTLQIKVPANLIDEWKNATNWSNYADKIVTEFTNTL